MNSGATLFSKIVAAGNDFLFAELSTSEPNAKTKIPSESEIRQLCDRHFGIGADGAVFMEKLSTSSSKWHFFNRDGSKAAMCGNAARAAAAWLVDRRAEFPHKLETQFGSVELSVLGAGQFAARVPYADKPLKAVQIDEHATLIDTGVPHAVVEIETSALSLKDASIAEPYRWPTAANADGANVTFFRRVKDSVGAIEAVTFERGVEDYTLSCGTGVLAAAVIASGAMKSGMWPAGGVTVINPGATLRVIASDFPNSLTLVGPANIVFRTTIGSAK